MRIVDSRYEGELRNFTLALRMVQLKARTSTVEAFTGLTADRIRKLRHRYDGGARSRRGKPPQQISHFIHTAREQREASLLAALLNSCGLLAGQRSPQAAAALTTVNNGFLLCDAYGYYLGGIEHPSLDFEYTVCLARCLLEGERLRFVRCVGCGIGMVSEPFPQRHRWCEHCAPRRGRALIH